MNCPSRNDELPQHEGWNQNPSSLAADITTREDLNGTVNRRTNQDSGKKAEDARTEEHSKGSQDELQETGLHDRAPSADGNHKDPVKSNSRRATIWPSPTRSKHPSLSTFFESFPKPRLPKLSDSSSSAQEESPPRRRQPRRRSTHDAIEEASNENANDAGPESKTSSPVISVSDKRTRWFTRYLKSTRSIIAKFLGFIGPGFMVAVAYIDPGNYSTDVSAGVSTKFKLLFVVLMSNIFAIVLQSLAIRLGTVTGLNLAEHCRAHLHPRLNIALYVLGEAAIISTDIAEVKTLVLYLPRYDG